MKSKMKFLLLLVLATVLGSCQKEQEEGVSLEAVNGVERGLTLEERYDILGQRIVALSKSISVDMNLYENNIDSFEQKLERGLLLDEKVYVNEKGGRWLDKSVYADAMKYNLGVSAEFSVNFVELVEQYRDLFGREDAKERIELALLKRYNPQEYGVYLKMKELQKQGYSAFFIRGAMSLLNMENCGAEVVAGIIDTGILLSSSFLTGPAGVISAAMSYGATVKSLIECSN